jgi:hypothetical protein
MSQLRIVFFNSANVGDSFFAEPFIRNVMQSNKDTADVYVCMKYNRFLYSDIPNFMDYYPDIGKHLLDIQTHDNYMYVENANVLYINTWIGSLAYQKDKLYEDHILMSRGLRECDLISYFRGYAGLLEIIKRNTGVTINFNPDIHLSYPQFPKNVDISKFYKFKASISKKVVFINNYMPMSSQSISIKNFSDITNYFINIGYFVILAEPDDAIFSENVAFCNIFYESDIKTSRDIYYNAKICDACDLSIYFDTGRNLIYFNTEFMDNFKRHPNRNQKIHFSTDTYDFYFKNLNRQEVVPFGYATQYIAENFAEVQTHLNRILTSKNDVVAFIKRTAVLYVFHEINARVIHFIQKCVFSDPNVDFYLIANDMNVQLQVPHATVINRQNIGWDFGGWSDCLLTDDMYKKYDTFIFANSTIMGPFLPAGFSGKWTDAFIGGLKNDVKLFGSTINTMRRPATNAHVQSYIFSADREAVEYLIKCEIFSMTKYAVDFRDAVFNKEIAMSRRIVENRWNIGSLMKHYNGVDFTKAPTGYDVEFLDDVMYPEWHNIAWTENEIIFIKGNRVLLNPTRRAPELG